MLKKALLTTVLAMSALTQHASAYYNDYKYKQNNINSYQFELMFGPNHSFSFDKDSIATGIQTTIDWNFAEKWRLNGRFGGEYESYHQTGKRDYKLFTQIDVGYALFKNNEVYVGGLSKFLTTAEEEKFVVGNRYYYSEDLYFDIAYEKGINMHNIFGNIGGDFFNDYSNDVIRLKLIVPFDKRSW